MSERFPDYDVLRKRESPSWNEPTRKVVDERLAIGADQHRFFTDDEWAVVQAATERLVPQALDRPGRIPVAALIDHKLHEDKRDGYRNVKLPPQQEAWRRGLAALNVESAARHKKPFAELGGDDQDALLDDMQEGRLNDPAWGGMPCRLFFEDRLMTDTVTAYYSHPTAWSEIGFGGPASPRGYVRLDFDKRDSWEAAEAYPGHEEGAREANRHVG